MYASLDKYAFNLFLNTVRVGAGCWGMALYDVEMLPSEMACHLHISVMLVKRPPLQPEHII